ncbi:MAG: hypothetical protein PHQ47_01345 [Candidatus Portnoybacteria bacterium]|nr:hypothetical protein [Candidatus Portnoybacteria bacterium]
MKREEQPEPLTAMAQFKGYMIKEIEQVDRALQSVDDEKRFFLTIDLLRLWFEAGMCHKEEKQEEAKSIFGKLFDEHGEKSLMYTITADSKQLRVWYGRPACMTSRHIESQGGNLLLEVCGHPELLERYLNAFCEIHKLKEILVPNGVRLYMNWRY